LFQIDVVRTHVRVILFLPKTCDTHPKEWSSVFRHQGIWFWLVLVIQCVQIEFIFLSKQRDFCYIHITRLLLLFKLKIYFYYKYFEHVLKNCHIYTISIKKVVNKNNFQTKKQRKEYYILCFPWNKRIIIFILTSKYICETCTCIII
jgi:hypothetical protein